MNFRRRGDLALMETVTIGFASIAVVVLLIPRSLTDRQQLPFLQARADTQRIAAGILGYQKDLGPFPATLPNGEPLSWMKGPGEEPRSSHDLAQGAESISALLVQNAYENEAWNGPYLRSVNPDPWGRCYLVHVGAFSPSGESKVWVLSAGRDGRIDTGSEDASPRGDDVGTSVN